MNLEELHALGLLELLDVELARALGRMTGTADAQVALAVALTSRSVRLGHTEFPLSLRAKDVWPGHARPPGELPAAETWAATLRESPLCQDGPLVLDAAGRLYLRRYWQLERDIAAQLAARATPPDFVPNRLWVEPALERLFPDEADTPQRQAARNALEKQVSLLCGGPGTGKTTTVAAIVALLVEGRLQSQSGAPEVMLLAPTGKAAARLGEAVSQAKSRVAASAEVLDLIPDQATTIHSALGMRREGLRFRRNADLPLEADIIVVDEASMIDLALMRQVLEATPKRARLLIVGDPNQLTSVEAGSVLRDLVSASANTWWKDRVTELTKTYRYDETQGLGQLVAAVRGGEPDAVDALLDRESADDLGWAPLDRLPMELDRASEHWEEALATSDPAEHFALRSRYVMLTPFRKGPIGTDALGRAIQARIASRGGDASSLTPIIIEENSHELRVYNGDFAMRLEGEPVKAIVQSDAEGFRELGEARLPRYSDAFALSVHKSQGSEFDEVLIVLPEEDAPLLTRELVYTAVSRARKSARIVGPRAVLHAALRRRAQRHSGLVDAISESAPPN